MAEKIYVDGLRTFPKRENAPSFVLGTLILTLDDLTAWWKANTQYLTDYQGKDQLKMQITQNDKGKINFTVDTWKKGDAKEPKATATPEDDGSSLPF
jgi:hypothetical protein